MAVKIRLAKTGKKHQISFRIVAADSRSKRDGKFLAILGFYNPYLKPPKNLSLKTEKFDFWVSKGAKPTAAVAKLLNDQLQNAKRPTTNAKMTQ